MGLNTTLNRLLADPDSRERSVLESDIVEADDNVEGNATSSFLNTLAGDLDARVIGIHKNTNQRLIIVTQDKTLLTLKRNIAQLGKKEWIAPLSTLSTIMIALITSNFKRALGLGPSEWRAIFIVCGFISFGWLCASLKRSVGAKSFHEVIQDIVFELGARPKPVMPSDLEKSETSTLSASSLIAACKAKKPRKRKSASPKKKQ
jgi:hypothetical protein